MFRIHRILLIIGAAGALHGQITQLDLHFQSRDIDFSTSNATKPFKSRRPPGEALINYSYRFLISIVPLEDRFPHSQATAPLTT